MKQFFYSILLFAMSYGMGLQAQSLDQPPVTEPILESSTPHLSPNRLDAMWDLEFDYDAAGALGYGALAGAYYFKDEFWVSQWNTDRLVYPGFRRQCNGYFFHHDRPHLSGRHPRYDGG